MNDARAEFLEEIDVRKNKKPVDIYRETIDCGSGIPTVELEPLSEYIKGVTVQESSDCEAGGISGDEIDFYKEVGDISDGKAIEGGLKSEADDIAGKELEVKDAFGGKFEAVLVNEFKTEGAHLEPVGNAAADTIGHAPDAIADGKDPLNEVVDVKNDGGNSGNEADSATESVEEVTAPTTIVARVLHPRK